MRMSLSDGRYKHVHVEGHPELSINFNRPFLFAEDSDQALNTLKETLETIDIPIYLKNTLFISDTVTVTTRVNSPLGHPPVNRCETGRDTPSSEYSIQVVGTPTVQSGSIEEHSTTLKKTPTSDTSNTLSESLYPDTELNEELFNEERRPPTETQPIGRIVGDNTPERPMPVFPSSDTTRGGRPDRTSLPPHLTQIGCVFFADLEDNIGSICSNSQSGCGSNHYIVVGVAANHYIVVGIAANHYIVVGIAANHYIVVGIAANHYIVVGIAANHYIVVGIAANHYIVVGIAANHYIVVGIAANHYIVVGIAANHYIVVGIAANHYIVVGIAANHYIVVGIAANHYIVVGIAANHYIVVGIAANHYIVVGIAANHYIVVGIAVSHYIVLDIYDRHLTHNFSFLFLISVDHPVMVSSGQ
ncbi:hypothetical protein BLNAU_24180 [Blattamonas nauphoetae]|uniref:Uncharacterized protein n=1 Tax=Blattamonas nauphoetae TaxID=2049346 RepID=A0ABQ9WP42_9EUKA|nr:hypothetical protein BLNAU_24180 [Blattamonas nauphoetae]